MSLLPNLDQMTDNEKLAVLESIQKSIAESKEIQKKKIGENVDLVVQALKKIESDIRDRYDGLGNVIEKRVASIKDGKDGKNGQDGRNGKDGKPGRDGAAGAKGQSGKDGFNGVDGKDGISISDAHIDFDGSLIITLSDGKVLNVGEVVSQDIAEKINIISTMSTNGAVAVKEEGTTLTSGVKSINFVGAGITATTSGDDVTVTVASGSGTVTSVAATGGTGISVSGSPITTSGTLTITNTAPDQTVALTQGGTTTITGTYPNFTISSADQFQGTVTNVAATVPAFLSVSGSPITTTGTLAISLSGTALPVANGGTGVTTSTGTTNVVLSNSPTLVTPALGTPSSATLTNATDLPISTGVSGLGTGIATALAVNVGTAGAPVVNGGALGTPSSGVVTNLTGTASININGTVGATTAATGAFTTLSATGVTTVQAGTAALPAITTTGDTNTGIFFPAADTIAFSEGGAEAMRINSSGNVGIGTASPSSWGKFAVQGTASGSQVVSAIVNTSGTANSQTVLSFDPGASGFNVRDSQIRATNNGTNQTSLEFYTANAATPVERMRIDFSGNLLVGKTSTSFSDVGVLLSKTSNEFTVNGAKVMAVNRGTDDGILIEFFQAGTSEGNISVSGTTVSYNGGHLSRWAQTIAPKDNSLVKGTVLSNLDEMNVYTDADGNPVENEQLNKVKVSDVDGDANVAGVFVNWTHDDAHDVDEINMAMTGDMIIRIAQGTTVQRGDLLMSAGDGTAKPQGDDIVRSKTVAKVTSIHVTCTYADGSFCVPCVLMAC